MQIELRDPLKLKLHPARYYEEEPLADDTAYEGLRRDVQERGITTPLLIDSQDRVISDPWPFWAALRCKPETVPVQIVPDGEVYTTLLGSLVWRKQYTKSAVAYLAYPAMKGAHQEILDRRAAYLRESHKSLQQRIPHSLHDGQVPRTVEELAKRIGLCERLFQDAAKVHELFTKHPQKRVWNDTAEELSFQEYYLPRLLASPAGGEHERPLGLGAIIAGIKSELAHPGRPHGGGRPEAANKQLELFERTIIQDQLNRWEYWQAFPEEMKAQHFANVRDKAETLEPEQCAELAEYYARLAREFRTAAAKRKEAGK
jgi:hypothetical protein